MEDLDILHIRNARYKEVAIVTIINKDWEAMLIDIATFKKVQKNTIINLLLINVD
jgi:hypothetical protein